MKTEIRALAREAQKASDALRETISELHLRIRAGLPAAELAMVEEEIRRLEAEMTKKISKDTEKVTRGRLPPAGLLPA